MRLFSIKTATLAAITFCVGCTNSNMGGAPVTSSQTTDIAEPTSPTSNTGATVSRIEGPIEVRIDWTDDGRCVRLQPDGACLQSMADARTAAPDLHKRYQNARNLAYMAHTLHPGISDELFRTQASYTEWWKKWFEPNDFFERNQGAINIKVAGVDPGEIQDATLEGHKLTYFTARVIAIDHGIQAFRNEVDFSSDDWTPVIVELETTGQARKSINDGATAIFGGLVEGFVHGKSPVGDVFLAAKPQDGAKPVVWRTTDKKIERFASWKELVAKHAEAASADIAVALADGISNYPLSSNLQLLKDADAYKKEYAENNWGLEKLRYWVDQVRVTQYTIADWDAIVNPAIRDGILVAHFKRGDRQPARMTYPLDEFAQASSPEFVDLFTSKTISDTKDGPRPIAPSEFDIVPAPPSPKPKLSE